MVEGGVGGVGTHPGEQDTTVNNTQCQQEMVVKNNPKEKANRNNGQTKIKRIVKNKLLSKLSSKITQKKKSIGKMVKIKRIVNKIFMPTRYKMLPYPSALMRVPAWGVIATSAVVMVLTMHRIKYSFSL